MHSKDEGSGRHVSNLEYEKCEWHLRMKSKKKIRMNDNLDRAVEKKELKV